MLIFSIFIDKFIVQLRCSTIAYQGSGIEYLIESWTEKLTNPQGLIIQTAARKNYRC
jgi:hypothetical protein